MHYHLKCVWQEFINRPHKQQLLEEAMNIYEQWYFAEEHLIDPYTDEMIKNMVEDVMKNLKEKYSKHPLFSVSNKQFSYWECNNIDDTEWNEIDSRQILNSICEVLSELNFHKIK